MTDDPVIQFITARALLIPAVGTFYKYTNIYRWYSNDRFWALNGMGLYWKVATTAFATLSQKDIIWQSQIELVGKIYFLIHVQPLKKIGTVDILTYIHMVVCILAEFHPISLLTHTNIVQLLILLVVCRASVWVRVIFLKLNRTLNNVVGVFNRTHGILVGWLRLFIANIMRTKVEQ